MVGVIDLLVLGVLMIVVYFLALFCIFKRIMGANARRPKNETGLKSQEETDEKGK